MAIEWSNSAALAARAENEDYASIEKVAELGKGRSTAATELDDLVRDVDTPTDNSPTPAGATEGRATEEDLQELIALGGRPGLSGRRGAGPSPKRQVRLPRDLDALLDERAKHEGKKPSVIMRDALDAYLRADA